MSLPELVICLGTPRRQLRGRQQDDVCGMGLNVSATGTYKRVSTAPPRFED